ncbi:hypothetical protein RFI_25581, partial [Reticulomyxa filosa]
MKKREKMNTFHVNFEKTQLFQMYKQILRRINKAQHLQELAKFFVLFSIEELKEVVMNKLNVEIEKGQKNENNTDFFVVQNKIRDVYLHTISFDEILPTTIQLYIVSFLDSDSFENLHCLSRSFWRIFSSSPSLFKKYTLKFFDFEQERTRENVEYQRKPKKLWIKHKSKQVMIGILPPGISDESVDGKIDNNVNAVDRLGQFPWPSIRKWHIDGIQFRILQLYLSQKPVSFYRSVFDSSSDTNWRCLVLGWKKFIENGKNLFEKYNISDFEELTGENHGRIYYASPLFVKDLQFEQTSDHAQKRQMKSIETNLNSIRSCTTANIFRDYISNRPIFCIEYDTLEKRKLKTFLSIMGERLSVRAYQQSPHTLFKRSAYQSPFQNSFFFFFKTITKIKIEDWKGSGKDLREYVLALNRILVSKETEKKTEIDDTTTDDRTYFNDLIVQVQYFYNHILYLRGWLESLCGTFEKIQFGQRSFTKFEIEINGGQITRIVHKDENETPKKGNRNGSWTEFLNDSDDNDNDNGNISIVNMYTWNDVQMGDEFVYICREGQSAMSNAVQYIVFGEFIDFTNEEQQESNNKDGNGWDIIDLLNADDAIEKNQLSALFSKSILFWKEKIKYAKEQVDLFISMLNKAHKSIRALTISDAFDQITVFPVLPNLVHLNLSNIKISSCSKSIDVKGLMPQLKTLKVERLSEEPYHNWKQMLEASETCVFDYSLGTVSEIEFLNNLILSCPNLLVLHYISEQNCFGVLKISSTLEWLVIDDPHIRLDLSQCKRINGLGLIYAYIF